MDGNIYDDINFTDSIPFKQAMGYHKDLYSLKAKEQKKQQSGMIDSSKIPNKRPLLTQVIDVNIQSTDNSLTFIQNMDSPLLDKIVLPVIEKMKLIFDLKQKRIKGFKKLWKKNHSK